MGQFSTDVDIPASLSARRGLTLGYGGLGIVIHSEAILGNNVRIDQNVTIGGNAIEPGVRVLGGNYYVGAGAEMLGPITIGDNVLIGANSVVVRDIRSGTVVVESPAREVRSGVLLKDLLWHTRSRG